MIVPAICDNDQCNAVWFVNHIFSGNSAVTLSRCTVSPCPKCKSTGTIPEGQYSSTRNILFDSSQWDTVSVALKRLHESMRQGASVKEVTDTIRTSPELSAILSRFVPRDIKELQSFFICIGLLVAAYEYCLAPDDKTQEMAVPTSVHDIIVNIDVANDTQDKQSQQSTLPQSATMDCQSEPPPSAPVSPQ